MPNTIPEIATLLREVEKKYGRKVNTSTDFESLSVVIERDNNEYISASTLKRMWGYVSLKPAPRVATLNILCHFIGHSSFADYRKALFDSPEFESGFFTTFYISASSLKEGDIVTIGWEQNKLLNIKHLGGGVFQVIDTYNTEIKSGDRFSAASFMLGCPLYIDHIDRDDGPTTSFVAGKTGGLNRVEKG